MNRYSEISTVKKPFFTPYAPVVVEKAAVFYDSAEKRRLALCKVVNLSDKTITSVSVHFDFYDKDGKKLGDGLDNVYDGLEVAPGESCGEKTPVLTNVKGVWKCLARALEVLFADGTKWTAAEDAKWGFVAPAPGIKSALENNYQYYGYKKRFGKHAEHVYESRNGIQTCTCGAINGAAATECRTCGVSFEELRTYDPVELTTEGMYFVACGLMHKKDNPGEIARARSLFENLGDFRDSRSNVAKIDADIAARSARKRKIKRRAIGFSSAAAVVVILLVLTFALFVPLARMSQADEYFASGDYDRAESIYYDLDGFGDSYQRITVIDVFRQLENKSSVSYLYDAVSRLADNGIDVRISYNTAGTSNTSDVTDTEKINGYDYFYGFSRSATKTGYTLDGWDFLAGTYDVTEEDPTFNLVVTARWKANSYTVNYGSVTKLEPGVTVTYDYNYSGASDPVSKRLENGTTINSLETPTRSGYVFTGWYKDRACQTRFYLGSTISSDMTLYAGWRVISASDCYSQVQINPADYLSSGDYYTLYTDYTSSSSKKYIYLVAENSGTHYVYYKNSSSSYYYKYYMSIHNLTTDTVIVSNRECSSNYYSNVSFSCSAGDVIAISVYKYDDPSTAYFYFSGFTSVSSTVRGNTAPTYVYKSGSSVSETVTYNENLTLITPTRPGYTFDGWYNGGTLVTSGKWTHTSTVSLTPKWKAKTYTVTLDTNGGGVSESTTLTATYGKVVTLPTPTKADCTFAGWYCNGVEYRSGLIWNDTESITLVARWTGYIDVTFNENYSGASSNVVTLADHGDVLSRPTNPTRSGYVFTGWYTDSSCTTRYTFTGSITDDMTLYAGWEPMVTSSNGAYSSNVLNPASYNSSSYSCSSYNSGTSSTSKNYYYVVAQESGEHRIYFANYSSSSYYYNYLQIKNVTTGETIRSNSYVSSSYYTYVAFNCSAGDVIEISTYRYNTSYTSYLCFYFDGFGSAPISTAEADYS